MSILCGLKNLTLSYGNKIIFNQSNLHVEHGDRIGLIGPNGKGKSSLFKILLEQISADKTTPAFIFDKATPEQGENFEYTCFLVPQQFQYDEKNAPSIKDYFFNFYPQLEKSYQRLESINRQLEQSESSKLLEEQTRLFEQIEHLKGWETLNRYQSYLKYFDLNNHDLPVDQLSGGEQKKILLSLGLSSNANLILWDEPTNHLDIETIKLLEDELQQSQKTFILISHDRYLLSKVCTKILHINNSKVEDFKGNYSDYLAFLNQKEEFRLNQLEKLKNSLRRETDWIRQGVKARRTRSKKRVENYQELSASVQKLKDQARDNIQLTLSNTEKKSKKLIEFKDVSIRFNHKSIFKNLDFTIFKGKKIGLVGANGAGKTTLVNLITGALSPTEGEIKRSDDLSINHFSQDRQELDKNISPFELLGQGRDHVIFEDGRTQHVIGYFQNFLFNKDEINRPLSSFSGGELARLQLASQLMRRGDLWIFDEPTNDLDIETIEILENKLAAFKGTVILISHDRTFLENVTDTIWIIEKNNLNIFNGGYAQAAPYIEAMFIEHEILGEPDTAEKEQKIPIKEENSRPEAFADNSKKLEEIAKEIGEKEKLIEDIDRLLGQFDFSVSDPEKAKLYGQLMSKKENTEEQLLELYEVQSELEK